LELKGKRALVTGAAIRIGRAIAMALAGEGVHVALHFGRSSEAAIETQNQLEALGVRAPQLQADLTQAEACTSLVGRASDALDGPLDILINSAAIYPDGELGDTTLDTWEEVMAVNLRAPFLLSQAFAAQSPDPGSIINILDARSNRPGTDHFAYRIAKAGLEAMTKNLALDLAPAIRVNGLALGAILPPPGAGPEHLEGLAASRIPLRRAGNAGVVAGNVLHLLRQDFLTGVIIPLDGGEFL